MDKYKRLSLNGLLYFWNKIENKLFTKVDKIEGKGLSTNDLTDELKEKILYAGTGSFTGVYKDLVEKPKINQVEVNGDMTLEQLGIQPKGEYALKSELPEVPTKVSQLANDSNYLNAHETALLIGEEIAKQTHFTFKKVDTLPSVESAEANVVYLVSTSNKSEQDGYIEYLLVDGKFEKIGSTDIDLSGYIHKDDLVEITNEEIDNITG